MTNTEFVKVGYGYRVLRHGWAVGRLVAMPDAEGATVWSVQDNDHRELYAFLALADAKRATRNLPSRG
jgi:hypothetical protein